MKTLLYCSCCFKQPFKKDGILCCTVGAISYISLVHGGFEVAVLVVIHATT